MNSSVNNLAKQFVSLSVKRKKETSSKTPISTPCTRMMGEQKSKRNVARMKALAKHVPTSRCGDDCKGTRFSMVRGAGNSDIRVCVGCGRLPSKYDDGFGWGTSGAKKGLSAAQRRGQTVNKGNA